MGRAPRIGIVGDAGVDLTFRISSGADEKAVVEDAERGLGGTGANAAVAAANLGSEVRLSACLGDDALGPWVLQALRAAQVGTDLTTMAIGRTEVAVALVEEAGRRLFVDPGIGYVHDGRHALELRSWADVLYLTHVEPDLVQLASAFGGAMTIVGIEPGEFNRPGWHEALGTTDIVLTNQAGASGAWAAVSGLRTAVIVTAGASGAILLSNGNRLGIPAPTVIAVDETGAGDCFAGTLAHYLGSGHDLESAARRAVIAASLSTTRLGTQTAFPSSLEIEDLRAKSDLSVDRQL